MDLDPIVLSRIQFAFTISFHIIFPSFTIGLAAWLATIEAVHLATGNEGWYNALYRRLFDFWLKVFAVSNPRLRNVAGGASGWQSRSR
jgi:cytochrome bd ubiquinol oxidase subunit I